MATCHQVDMPTVAPAAHTAVGGSSDPPEQSQQDPPSEPAAGAGPYPPVMLQIPTAPAAASFKATATTPGPVTAEESIRELRGWLMVLATLIASITYASGLSPPGGFETVKNTPPPPRQPRNRTDLADLPKPNNISGMIPLLYAVSPARCRTFYYAYTAAFALSLSIILLLGSQDLRRLARVKALEILVALDVIALLVAYLAGAGSFGDLQLVVCAGIVLIVPVALVAMVSRLCGKYFWDEL